MSAKCAFETKIEPTNKELKISERIFGKKGGTKEKIKTARRTRSSPHLSVRESQSGGVETRKGQKSPQRESKGRRKGLRNPFGPLSFRGRGKKESV